MASIVEKALKNVKPDSPEGALEGFFDSLGMMRGTNAIYKRFIFGLAAGTTVIWALRPSFFFDDHGNQKIWKPFAPDGKNGVLFPWWTVPLSLGLFFSLFV